MCPDALFATGLSEEQLLRLHPCSDLVYKRPQGVRRANLIPLRWQWDWRRQSASARSSALKSFTPTAAMQEFLTRLLLACGESTWDVPALEARRLSSLCFSSSAWAEAQ